jgi:kinetochore protein NNF1
LNAKIQTTSSQNASLAQTIAAQRTEIETLLAQLDNVVADLEEAGNMVGEHGMKLTEEAREAEGVLSET